MIHNHVQWHTDAAMEESKRAAEKAAADASNAVSGAVDGALHRAEAAADQGLKNAGQVVDAKIKDADKFLSEKRDAVSTSSDVAWVYAARVDNYTPNFSRRKKNRLPNLNILPPGNVTWVSKVILQKIRLYIYYEKENFAAPQKTRLDVC